MFPVTLSSADDDRSAFRDKIKNTGALNFLFNNLIQRIYVVSAANLFMTPELHFQTKTH